MKNNRVWLALLVVTGVLAGCGVPQAEYDKLKAENTSLQGEVSKLNGEVDELRNGESRLSAVIDKALGEKNYTLAKSTIETLKAKHPESAKNVVYAGRLPEIDKGLAADQAAKEAAEKEQKRLANLNNTGIWAIRFYKDNFGVATSTPYIETQKPISGTFSNSATQDSPLLASLLIDSKDAISIMLYEYARNNPVKVYSRTYYTVRIRDQKDSRYELQGYNYGDRVQLEGKASATVHSILMKGGRVQFYVGSTTGQYNFTIEDADFYDNAFEKLTSQTKKK